MTASTPRHQSFGRPVRPEDLAQWIARLYTDGDRPGLFYRRATRHNPDIDAPVERMDIRIALAPFLVEPRARRLILEEAAGKEYRPVLQAHHCVIIDHERRCPKRRPSSSVPGTFDDCLCVVRKFSAAMDRDNAANPQLWEATSGFLRVQLATDRKLLQIYRLGAQLLNDARKTTRPRARRANRRNFVGRCDRCPELITRNSQIYWNPRTNERWHAEHGAG